MKKTKQITMSAMLSALAVVTMLAAYFPYLTYAFPAIASFFVVVAVIELGTKWAMLTYLSSALLSLLFAEPEAKILYILFFGFYPIIKEKIERIKNVPLEYIVKLVIFNISIVLAYSIIVVVLSVPIEGMGDFGRYGTLIVLAMSNVVFFVFDFALTRLIATYMLRLHKNIGKFLR